MNDSTETTTVHVPTAAVDAIVSNQLAKDAAVKKPVKKIVSKAIPLGTPKKVAAKAVAKAPKKVKAQVKATAKKAPRTPKVKVTSTTCQAKDCGKKLPYGGRGQPKKWCDAHKYELTLEVSHKEYEKRIAGTNVARRAVIGGKLTKWAIEHKAAALASLTPNSGYTKEDLQKLYAKVK